jgi:hypothetical protein
MAAQKSLGRWLLYSLCLAPAAVMLGYYGLEYIPGQRAYFMSLRFRALADIGGQAAMKIDRLFSALDYATRFDGRSAEYIQALVPELAYRPKDCGKAPSPVQFGVAADTVRFKADEGCAADASLSGIFSSFASDDLFDDVIIAESGGRVIYQHSQTGPRIAALGALQKAAAGSQTNFSGTTGADADAVRYVWLDDAEFALLLQPVRISVTNAPEQTLMVGGLVRSQRLAEESRHVPPMYLLVIFVPLLVVFLSGPFLKILLLTRTGRLGLHDLALLSLCAVITAALLTLLLTSWCQFWTGDGPAEANLKEFAGSLDRHLKDDIARMLSTLRKLDAQLPAYIARNRDPDRTDLLSRKAATGLDATSAPFDFAFWTNQDGCQAAKWTTKLRNTQRVHQTSQGHFQDLMAGRFWSIDGREFTLQSLVSPTTSQPIVVVGMQPQRRGMEMGCRDDATPRGRALQSSEIREAAIVGLLPSVAGPVIPPGAGFAIFDARGEVIFHSSLQRNLHENLFDEIDSPGPWKAAVAMRVPREHGAYYRGRKYQLRVQPVASIQGCPWNIAVFYELEPRQAMIGVVWIEYLILFLAPLGLLAAGLLLLSAILRAVRQQTWRQQVEFLLIRLWPDPARAPVFLRLAKELAALAVLSLAAGIFGSRHAYWSAAWLLPFCYLAPALGLFFTALRLWKPHPARWNRPAAGERQPAYIASISLLLVQLAVVPTLGLFSICYASESRIHVMYWQREVANSWQARRSRIEAAIRSAPGMSDEGRKVSLQYFRDRDASPEWGGKEYAANFWQTRIATKEETPGTEDYKPGRWQALLVRIRPEEQAGAMEAGALASDPEASAPSPWRTARSPSRSILRRLPGANPIELASELPEIGVGLQPIWWAGVLALLAGAFAWNCRALCRLFAQDFDYSPLPVLTALGDPAALESDVLLLGLPLARKDETVRQWLGYTPPRVNLYTARCSENWLAEITARLSLELAVLSSEAPGHIWVHISNLETKLGDPQDRQAVAGLLENLVTMDVGGRRPRLIVTSTIDPVFHFDSMLGDGRKKTYENPLTEPELQRFSRLLHNFRKAQVAGAKTKGAEYTAKDARTIAYDECQHHPALLAIGEEVAQSAPYLRREALLARIAERAEALYKLFWACCTRSERLLLIQLAQTGLVNPLCLDILQALARKGLVLPGPRPRIVNETFRRFVATAEAPADVRRWENEAGESSWLVIRNVLFVLIIAGLAVVAMTQRDAMQTVTAVLTGVGATMAGLFRLAGYFGGRREPPAESV